MFPLRGVSFKDRDRPPLKVQKGKRKCRRERKKVARGGDGTGSQREKREGKDDEKSLGMRVFSALYVKGECSSRE